MISEIEIHSDILMIFSVSWYQPAKYRHRVIHHLLSDQTHHRHRRLHRHHYLYRHHRLFRLPVSSSSNNKARRRRPCRHHSHPRLIMPALCTHLSTRQVQLHPRPLGMLHQALETKAEILQLSIPMVSFEILYQYRWI